MRSNLKAVRLLIVLFSLLCAFAGADDRNARSAALTGNPIYQKNCARCHGDTAEGRHFRGPSLVSDKTAGASTDDLRNIVTNGKGHMPKFGGKLATGDIGALVEQIKGANAK